MSEEDPKHWHLLENGRQAGPLSTSEIAARGLDPTARAWHEGMPTWRRAGEIPEFAPWIRARLPSDDEREFPDGARHPWQRYYPTDAVRKIRLRFRMWLTAHVIFVVTLVAAMLMRHFDPRPSDTRQAVEIALIIVLMTSFLATVILKFPLIHVLWSLTNGWTARTNPGDAVGYSFIPLFNIYWVFVAFWGLADDLGKAMDLAGIPAARPNSRLAGLAAFLIAGSLVPYLGLPFIPAWFVVAPFFMLQITRAGIALAEPPGETR